jgi:hypothetical protein
MKARTRAIAISAVADKPVKTSGAMSAPPGSSAVRGSLAKRALLVRAVAPPGAMSAVKDMSKESQPRAKAVCRKLKAKRLTAVAMANSRT